MLFFLRKTQNLQFWGKVADQGSLKTKTTVKYKVSSNLNHKNQISSYGESNGIFGFVIYALARPVGGGVLLPYICLGPTVKMWPIRGEVLEGRQGV